MVESALWYDQRETGLGERFLATVAATQLEVQRNPDLGTPHRRRTRKWRVPGFPHSIVYRTEPDHILVVAIAHGNRQEGYWEYRLD